MKHHKLKTALFYSFFLAVIAGIPQSTIAQYTKCGTKFTPLQVATNLAPGNGLPGVQFAPNSCLGKTLSITAHIIADSSGNYGITVVDIENTILDLNNKFAPICLSFELCNVNYIPNHKYYQYLKTTEEEELITLYSVPNTINIYYPLSVETAPGGFVGGYAYFPGGPDFIALSQMSIGSIVHEMGHFFGLYHTFETSNGVELVNESNCVTAGDLVCDTPADPGLSNTPSPDCQLAPYIMDVNGQWYVPQIGNVMSYYSEDCTCGFTTGQLERMAFMYQTFRFYLW